MYLLILIRFLIDIRPVVQQHFAYLLFIDVGEKLVENKKMASMNALHLFGEARSTGTSGN